MKNLWNAFALLRLKIMPLRFILPVFIASLGYATYAQDLYPNQIYKDNSVDSSSQIQDPNTGSRLSEIESARAVARSRAAAAEARSEKSAAESEAYQADMIAKKKCDKAAKVKKKKCSGAKEKKCEKKKKKAKKKCKEATARAQEVHSKLKALIVKTNQNSFARLYSINARLANIADQAQDLSDSLNDIYQDLLVDSNNGCLSLEEFAEHKKQAIAAAEALIVKAEEDLKVPHNDSLSVGRTEDLVKMMRIANGQVTGADSASGDSEVTEAEASKKLADEAIANIDKTMTQIRGLQRNSSSVCSGSSVSSNSYEVEDFSDDGNE